MVINSLGTFDKAPVKIIIEVNPKNRIPQWNEYI
jgi:hypothetical protein